MLVSSVSSSRYPPRWLDQERILHVLWVDSEWIPGDEATLVAKSEPTSVLHFNVQIQGMTCIRVRPPYIYPPWPMP